MNARQSSILPSVVSNCPLERQQELASHLSHLMEADSEPVDTLKSWAQWILRGAVQMLNQQAFEEHHGDDWRALDACLTSLESLRPWLRR